MSRNFQVFDALEFLAEVTQHIPDKPALGLLKGGQHLIHYLVCEQGAWPAQEWGAVVSGKGWWRKRRGCSVHQAAADELGGVDQEGVRGGSAALSGLWGRDEGHPFYR
jgi:hypothetical protein